MQTKNNYGALLKDPRWQRRRLEVFDRDNFTCCLCGDDKNEVQVHHLKYEGNPWDVDMVHLRTLCVLCHEISHELHDFAITKVVQKIFPEYGCYSFFAYTDKEVVLLYKFPALKPVIITTIPYFMLDIINLSKPAA